MRFASSTMSGPVTTIERRSHTWPGEWTVEPSSPRRRPLEEFAPTSIVLPPTTPRTAPKLQEALSELYSWTGWSMRELASAIGSTHPTIDSVLRGESNLARQPLQATHLFQLHDLVQRLQVVSHGDKAEIGRALRTPGSIGVTALDTLRSTGVAGAYIQALDVIRPPRSGGMMKSRFPRRPGEGSSALSDA